MGQYGMSRGIRAPVEQLYRALVKNFFLNEDPPDGEPPLPGRFGSERVLSPFLGEMGAEIRYHVARTEPWLRNGWKVLTRRPAFYPKGSTIEAPEFFEQVDAILRHHGAIGSHGAVHIPPLEHGKIDISRDFNGTEGKITVGLSDITKVTHQSLLEIELRTLFLEWFYFEGRPITDFDRYNLSFDSTAVGNWEYYAGAALRPSYLPPDYVNPPEPIGPHVGVQMRNLNMGLKEEPRNSNVKRMMHLAQVAAAHLGLDLMVYGDPKGCYLPPDARCTWNSDRTGNLMQRELGYLKSCRLMLAPDSGWADLMAWLEVPTLLEQIYVPGAFEPLRPAYGGKLQMTVPGMPIAPQVDALLAEDGPVLPPATDSLFVDARMFPWEP
jgi:hypothetical protein